MNKLGWQRAENNTLEKIMDYLHTPGISKLI